jgi:hypothetical protein
LKTTISESHLELANLSAQKTFNGGRPRPGPASAMDAPRHSRGTGAFRPKAAAVAKKHGFASLAQYDDVSTNITMIMSGINPQTKKFTEPPEQIKNEIAGLKADKSVPEADKKEGLAQLEAALKNAKPIQFKENIALVLKYFDQLAPIMQDSTLRPAD